MEEISNEQLFRSMLRIRLIEEAIADNYSDQEMRCPMHLCIGQEAIAVGVCATLRRSDRVYSNHRAHGHYLAKGGNLNSMIAELYARTTGCCGGRGGSMHLIDLDVGFMGATPIVGGTVPLAVGSAWASSLHNTNEITVVFFGDGCFEEGVVHESLNFAALHNLPIIFVCENNEFSVYTRRNERQPERPIFSIAAAHGIDARAIDGNIAEDVIKASVRAIENARKWRGPQFLEFKTYRWREHCGPDFDDHLKYRSANEIEVGINDCPIAKMRRVLLTQDVEFSKREERYKVEIQDEIARAFDFALSSPIPTPTNAQRKIHA